MAKKIKLVFDGYFNEKTLPTRGHRNPGIYTVYAGRQLTSRECEFRELLYIGEANNVVEQLEAFFKSKKGPARDKYQELKKQLNTGEILIFAIADVNPADKEQAVATLIYYHYKYMKLRLPCNRKYKDSFDFSTTSILTCNENKFLKSQFFLVD